MFLRAAVVDEATSPYKLIKIDLENKENFLPFDSVKLPTATKSLLASSKLYDNKHLSSKKSDNAKLQYEEFINDVVIRYQEDFLNFDMANNRLDQFFGKFLNSLDKYKSLWKVMKVRLKLKGEHQLGNGDKKSGG